MVLARLREACRAVTFQVLTREEVEAKRDLQVQHKPSGEAVEAAQAAMRAAPPAASPTDQPEVRHTRDSAFGLPVDERFIADDGEVKP